MVETKQAAWPRRSTTERRARGLRRLQLLGESYQLGEETLPGLGLADLRTVREEGPR